MKRAGVRRMNIVEGGCTGVPNYHTPSSGPSPTESASSGRFSKRIRDWLTRRKWFHKTGG
jgi:hypothetical protein